MPLLDLHVRFSSIFCPFPSVALNLILAAVSFVDKIQILVLMFYFRLSVALTNGVLELSKAYQDVFEEHLCLFNDFADYCRKNGCPNLVQMLLEQMHDHGW